MKNLPRDLQELIAVRLDPKSSARLRAVSKDMKAVVDSTRPPTGSYQQKTGRFQKRFTLRGMEKCARKQVDDFMHIDDLHYHAHFKEFGRLEYRKMKKAYEKNTLLRTFKSITAEQSEDDYWKKSLEIFPEMSSNDTYRREIRESCREQNKDRRTFRRMVIRLLKLWAKSNASYIETLQLVRRRNGIYTEAEERQHRDRVMDAIIVQTSVLHPRDDPTTTILGKHGEPLSLDEKIKMLVKMCSTHLQIKTTRVRS